LRATILRRFLLCQRASRYNGRMADNRSPLFTDLDFTVCTYDIDFAGHVSNIVYLRWLEQLRLELLTRYYPLPELMEARTIPVVTRTDIRYWRSVELFDSPHGSMWLADHGRFKVALDSEIVVDGEVRASAHQEGGFINTDTGRPMPLPTRFVDLIEEWPATGRA